MTLLRCIWTQKVGWQIRRNHWIVFPSSAFSWAISRKPYPGRFIRCLIFVKHSPSSSSSSSSPSSRSSPPSCSPSSPRPRRPRRRPQVLSNLKQIATGQVHLHDRLGRRAHGLHHPHRPAAQRRLPRGPPQLVPGDPAVHQERCARQARHLAQRRQAERHDGQPPVRRRPLAEGRGAARLRQRQPGLLGPFKWAHAYYGISFGATNGGGGSPAFGAADATRGTQANPHYFLAGSYYPADLTQLYTMNLSQVQRTAETAFTTDGFTGVIASGGFGTTMGCESTFMYKGGGNVGFLDSHAKFVKGNNERYLAQDSAGCGTRSITPSTSKVPKGPGGVPPRAFFLSFQMNPSQRKLLVASVCVALAVLAIFLHGSSGARASEDRGRRGLLHRPHAAPKAATLTGARTASRTPPPRPPPPKRTSVPAKREANPMNLLLRRTISFALLAAFASALVGCGSKEDKSPPPTRTTIRARWRLRAARQRRAARPGPTRGRPPNRGRFTGAVSPRLLGSMLTQHDPLPPPLPTR